MSRDPSKPGEQPSPFDGEGRPSRHRLPKRVFRPAAPPGPATVDPRDRAMDSLRVLFHELANLVDASSRSLGLAKRALEGRSESSPPDQALRYVNAAGTALSHLADLVRDALASSAATIDEMGRTIDHPRPPDEAVRHAVESLTPLAADREITIAASIDERLAQAPPAPLFAAVANVLRNAIEAAPRAGRISLRAEIHSAAGVGAEVLIRIVDDGPGISKQAQGRAFQPGFSTKGSGRGLGLAVANDLIEGLGGSLALRTAGPEDVPRGWPRAGAVATLRYPIKCASLDSGPERKAC